MKPSYEIELCFGEEYPDPKVPKTQKLILAQVDVFVNCFKKSFWILSSLKHLTDRYRSDQMFYLDIRTFSTLLETSLRINNKIILLL